MAFSKNRRLADLVSSAGEVSSFVDASVTHADLHTSMDLTGKTVTVANASTGDSDTTAANTAFVQQEIAALVDSAPGTLNTLNELAAALGDDASFSTTVTNSIATKLPLAGGTLTGNLIGKAVTLAPDTAGKLTIRLTTNAANDGRILLRSDTTDKVDIQANGASYFNGGNVGIGQASPSAPLDVVTSSNVYTAEFTQSNTSNGDGVFISVGSTAAADYALTVRSDAGNTSVLAAKADGKVGIGTFSPTTPLHTATGSNGSGLVDVARFQNTGTTVNDGARIQLTAGTSTSGAGIGCLGDNLNSAHLVLHSGGNNERMRIKSDGKVGIGDNNPTRELSLKKTSDHSIMAITTSTSTLAGIVMGDTSADDQGGVLYNNNGDYLYFRAGGANRWNITGAGHFTPNNQHTFDIGGTNAEVRNIYAQGISFASNANYAGMSSELLDDYEEGEVAYYGGGAPRWYGSAGAFENTGQLGGNKIYYTKIGNMVHLHGQISWTNTGSHGGNIRCDLPFPVVNGHRGALALGLVAGLNTGANGFITLTTETGSSVAYLLEISSGVGHSHTSAADLTGTSYRVISFAGSYTTSS